MNKVTLISYTQPAPSLLEENIDDINKLIAYCARVSNPKNQNNMDTHEKLIRYLIDHAHWSPFEMADMTLEIRTTRDIARQILRHRSFSFQEFSQRYAQVDKNSFIVREARLQDVKNRQNSIETGDEELQARWNILQEEVLDTSLKAYDWALRNGIAKEVARAVLPEGMTESVLYMKGSIRSWIHYCSDTLGVRRGNDTQKEHRLIAEQCAYVISQWGVCINAAK